MSQVIALDPERMATIEPWEQEGPNTTWRISPYEVPRRIDLKCGSGLSEIRAIHFDYSGGETGNEWTPLDEIVPPVLVRSGWETRKILELLFASPISLAQLPAIADRLMRRSTAFRVKATKFNYQMIAAIFQNWNEAVQPAD